MRSLTRWEPFGDLISLRDAMDRLLEEGFIRPRTWWLAPFGVEEPPIDMYETDDEVVVEVAVPGVKPEEIDVTIKGDTLTIKGETKAESEIKKESYIRQERRYGRFSRSIALPSGIDADKAKATFKDGLLTLTIPKAEAIKPKRIEVKAR